MSISFQIALVGAACLLSAFGGATLKLAADHGHAGLLAVSLTTYSLASLLLYACYRGGAESFALLTFGSLLGTLFCVQLLSSLWLDEPLNGRALAVLVLAIAGFAWAVDSASATARHPSNQTMHNQQEPDHV